MIIKRKVIGILVILLMLATIPLAAGMTVDSKPDDPQTTAVGRTIIRGFVLNYRSSGFGHKFFALRIHYTTFTGSERGSGNVIFRPVEVGREANIGFKWIGPAGMFGYMLGATFKGGINY